MKEVTSIEELKQGLTNNKDISIQNDLDFSSSDVEWIDISYSRVLDGNGHTIRNFKCSLLKDLKGTVKNLTLNGSQIESVRKKIQSAGICETNYGDISNCSVENSTINGEYDVGGICRDNYGDISNCSVENSTINGEKAVGGICVFNNSEIFNCSVENIELNGKLLGGICEKNKLGEIVSSTVEKTVFILKNDKDNKIGGITVENKWSKIVNNTVKNIDITKEGRSEIGGIACENSEGSTIKNCISKIENYFTMYNSGLIESCISLKKDITYKQNDDIGDIESCFVVSENKSKEECTGDVHTVSTIDDAKTLSLF